MTKPFRIRHVLILLTLLAAAAVFGAATSPTLAGDDWSGGRNGRTGSASAACNSWTVIYGSLTNMVAKSGWGDGLPAVGCHYSPPYDYEITVVNMNCDAGEANDGGSCFAPKPKNNGCQENCDTEGNPITPSNGNKFEMTVDFSTGGSDALSFIRYYNSLSPSFLSLGWKWTHNFETRLVFKNGTTTEVHRPDGKVLTFTKSGSDWVPDSDVVLVLAQSGSDWVLTDEASNSETYDANGKLTSIATLRGYTQTLAYDGNGTLITVTDTYGRQITFAYNAEGFLDVVTSPGGQEYRYIYEKTYDYTGMLADRLREVAFPDDTLLDVTDNPRVTYVYEEENAPYFLTGIIDENGERHATFDYDSELRATLTEHAGGAERHTITYNADGSRVVTDALGEVKTLSFAEIAGAPKHTGDSIAATANFPAMSTSTTYDAKGFVESEIDPKGNVTEFVHDARGLETSRTEAFGTPDERTITTTWHPTFRVPDVVTEPGRTTDYDYDAQGRMTSVTITDTTSHTVPYSTNGETRTWTYTYSPSGQVLTVDGPRTDVSDVRTFEYDLQGNREKVIDALGHTTHITAFDGRGLPLTILDPNNVQTELSYDPRGRLKERRVKQASGDAVTTFDYDAVGQIPTITRPNGVKLHYAYDAAHRLEAVRNDLGERLDYALDAMGNRTGETVKSADGTIKRTQTNTFDELGRLLQSIGAASQTWTYGYDKNGNLETITDPATEPTTRGFDALDRLIQVTDPDLETAGYKYDARDNLTEVTDQRSLTTTYTYNAFGDVIQLDSPDTGITVYQVDAAGNVTQMTDARGVVTDFTYDALNRVLTKSFPADATQNVTYVYDDTLGGNPGKGRLTSLSDQSGSTAYRYDHRGNLVEETRTIDGNSFTTGYAYDLADNLVEITYPSGRIVTYTRDSLARVSAVSTRSSAGATPVTVASEVAYLPFGPMEALELGNGMTVTYAYDQDYRLEDIDTGDGVTTVQDLTIAYDGRDNITAITDNLDTARDQGFGYDKLSRLTSATGAYGSIGYTYDGVGNRKTRDVTLGGVTTNEVYTYAIDSNRLETVDVGGTLRTVTHGLSGNITADDRGAGADLSFDYNQDDRLAQVTQGGLPLKQYLYNAGGERVVKQAPGGLDPEYFHYDQGARLLAESDGTGAYPRSYIFLNDMIIAQVEPGGGGGAPIDVILDNGATGTTPTGTWDASSAGGGYEGTDHQVRPAPPMPPLGGELIDNGDAGFSSVVSCSASTAVPGYEGSDYLACPVDNGADHEAEVPLALVNPDAQTGDLTGWTNEVGAFGVRTPAGANFYFYAGSVGHSVMYQDVAIPPAQHAAVDAGGWFARLTWLHGSHQQKDRGSVRFEFLDGSGLPTGPGMENVRSAPYSWTAREYRAAVPPLTRTIRVKLRGLRTFGTENSAYFRDLALSLLKIGKDPRRLSLGPQNGGGELGDTSSWTLETGSFGVRPSANLPTEGDYYLYAGTSANSIIYQDLALPAGQHAAVDAGQRTVEVTWRQGSHKSKDKGAVILQFLDGGGLSTGPDVESDLVAASKWWWDRALSAAVPAGTRTIRLKLRGLRSNGTENSAYFDAVAAKLLLYGSGASALPPRLASWSFQVPTSGDYEVYAKWPAAANHASNAGFAVYHTGATAILTKSQRQGGGLWTKLGTFSFDAATDHWVELLDQGDGTVIADAIYVVQPATSFDSYTWAPSLPSAGSYAVYAKWVAEAGRATDAVYGIYHQGGVAEVSQNQRAGGTQWNYLGSYDFDPASNPIVVLAGGSDGTLSADAIRFVGAGAPPGEVRFVHNDHLGTPQKMTDNLGTVIWDRIQTPFGLDHSVTGTGTTPVRFPGQYADGESSLYYNYFRDYDPSLGRYVESDPIGLGGGLNTYRYADMSPLRNVDPLGLMPCRCGPVGTTLGTRNESGEKACDYFCRCNCKGEVVRYFLKAFPSGGGDLATCFGQRGGYGGFITFDTDSFFDRFGFGQKMQRLNEMMDELDRRCNDSCPRSNSE